MVDLSCFILFFVVVSFFRVVVVVAVAVVVVVMVLLLLLLLLLLLVLLFCFCSSCYCYCCCHCCYRPDCRFGHSVVVIVLSHCVVVIVLSSLCCLIDYLFVIVLSLPGHSFVIAVDCCYRSLTVCWLLFFGSVVKNKKNKNKSKCNNKCW